jgi:hypothetical protein
MAFWTKWNAPRNREMWKLLAEKIGGELIEGDSWKEEKVILNYRNRIFTLDTVIKGGKHKYFENRIKCSFVSTNKFTLKIFLENAFTHAGKIFGINDIELDDVKFDNEFYVKSNKKETAIHFLNSNDLQKLYFAATKNLDLMVSVEIKNSESFFALRSYPANTSLIIIRANSEITDIDRLISWFNLCKITLDRLIEIGEAEDVSPDIQ